MQEARGTQLVIGNLFCNRVQWVLKRTAITATLPKQHPNPNSQPTSKSN